MNFTELMYYANHTLLVLGFVSFTRQDLDLS